MYSLLIFLILLVNWVVFSGIFDLFHLTLGVICCAVVTWMSSDLLFEDRSRTFGERCKEALRLPGYDYDRHFGGVHYLFLRGMRPENGPATGVFATRPPLALVDELDVLMTREAAA